MFIFEKGQSYFPSLAVHADGFYSDVREAGYVGVPGNAL